MKQCGIRATLRLHSGTMSDHTQVPGAPAGVDRAVLAARVRAKRESEKLSLRAAAKLLGMSAATISRVESGEHLPERDHLLQLSRWAGVRLDEDVRRRRNQDVHGPSASTMEAVELHLRADKNLDTDDAEMLVGLMRTAYTRLSQRKA
jgi:transcriptional regulator with XRE-family HTH domain